ncbi:hypothetical protein F4861DRAFT_523569 [Xylaria intraflava]|nr:hypothetical protein F4861DRAFT_523569 [Xylaria intraflava]
MESDKVLSACVALVGLRTPQGSPKCWYCWPGRRESFVLPRGPRRRSPWLLDWSQTFQKSPQQKRRSAITSLLVVSAASGLGPNISEMTQPKRGSMSTSLLVVSVASGLEPNVPEITPAEKELKEHFSAGGLRGFWTRSQHFGDDPAEKGLKEHFSAGGLRGFWNQTPVCAVIAEKEHGERPLRGFHL